MPRAASLLAIDRVDICEARRAGKSLADIANDLEISTGTVARYCQHIPDGSLKDFVRAAILQRADRGESLDAIASLENCDLSFVVRVLRARYLEDCARKELGLEPQVDDPAPYGPRPKTLPNFKRRRYGRSCGERARGPTPIAWRNS